MYFLLHATVVIIAYCVIFPQYAMRGDIWDASKAVVVFIKMKMKREK